MKICQSVWIIWFFIFSSIQIHGQTKSYKSIDQSEPPPNVLDTPVSFSGWKGAVADPEKLQEIRLGFFVTEDSADPVGGPMLNAATLALEAANSRGGFQGVPFRLVIRWASDPWGAGSKEVIKLVYQDSVWALIGSLDGKATHVAEQVITKAWVPLISPVSADPTLTYIRIPWIFRLPPDDQVQAQVILERGIETLSLQRVGLITSTDHDGRIFAERMVRAMTRKNIPPVFHFQVPLSNVTFNHIVDRVAQFNPAGVIMRLPRAKTLEILSCFQNNAVDIPILIPWIPGLLEEDLAKQYDGDILYVQPFTETGNPAYAVFAKVYEERYGIPPTPCAAYTYDAVNLLVQSLQTSGLNRASLRNSIELNDNYQGVTGIISWDNGGGNRVGTVTLIEIIKGRPIIY
jgi:branched-chain amino acid transport system substrate-binding protein